MTTATAFSDEHRHLAAVSNEDLRLLFDALRVATAVIDGLAFQPWFMEGGEHTPAGNALFRYARDMGVLGDQIARHVRLTPPKSEGERRERLHLLLQDEAALFDTEDMNAAEQALELIDAGKE
ncbi:hypothetical protein BOSEA31B_11477 [Hyphomicrobiales bacterium]|nr:hypothetical protein BOSEA31B_11477 [Hyphomicrobiales bacterium]CAH1697273.1 hypothetical protein BOSEA1005_10310 [Hyphomicrobiales bacterium]CAI0342840.1 hypothetical protein BO1005MUT1_10133 [Hyphomicrobiales bacterium]